MDHAFRSGHCPFVLNLATATGSKFESMADKDRGGGNTLIARLMRDGRGSPSLEALFVLPVILMLFFMVVETGFIMCDWATVNYAAASAAVNAAREGKFSEGVRSGTADYLRDWTTNGRAFIYERRLPNRTMTTARWSYGEPPPTGTLSATAPSSWVWSTRSSSRSSWPITYGNGW
ncbi:MAG: TadE/TadG family type IV pilus assembly protein [Bacillota bacterium]